MIRVADNITLKPLAAPDAEAIFNMIDAEREYLRRWLPFVDNTLDVAYTQSFVDAVLETVNKQFPIYYNGKFVGLIGFKDTDLQNKKTEIGYWLSESVQGFGIVTQSVQYLLQMAFGELSLNRVQIKAAIQNKKSRKIPERLGFTFEGVERDGELLVDNIFTDIAVYSLLAKDYKK